MKITHILFRYVVANTTIILNAVLMRNRLIFCQFGYLCCYLCFVMTLWLFFSGCVWFVYHCFSGLRHWRCDNQTLILLMPVDHSMLSLLYASLTRSHRIDPELGFIVYVMMTGWHRKTFRIICPLWRNLSITGEFPSQNATNTKLLSILYCWPEQAVRQTWRCRWLRSQMVCPACDVTVM